MNGASTTYQQQAYTHVKDLILRLKIKPGAYVTDTHIAKELKISRTPVREAFRRLEREGLLVYEARRGWKVYALSMHDIHEIFNIKVALEGMVARQAAACQDETLRAHLRDAITRMRRAADNNNIEEWFAIDPELHGLIFEMAGNQRACRIIENLNDQYHRVRVGFAARTGRMARSIVEHEAIVAAILAQDGELAESLMRDHQNELRNELVHLLEAIVLPFVSDGV